MEDMVALVTVWGMRVLSALVILIIGWMGGNYVQKFFRNMKRLDATLRTFLGGLAKYGILAIALVTVLGQFGVETASLLAVLGAAGLAIGLALQGTLSNVAAGVMMLILRPFSVGDYIEFKGVGGTVKSLGLFGCELNTPDNIYIYAPNSTIWNSDIYNYNRNMHRRQDIAVGISYDDDINKAFKTIASVLNSDKRLITTEGKEPQVMVAGMGESSVDLKVRVWSKTADFWSVKWDLTKTIKEALDKDGITIPFPTRTMMMLPQGGEGSKAKGSGKPAGQKKTGAKTKTKEKTKVETKAKKKTS